MQTHTHHLAFTATEVRKRYVLWDDGEADREWLCLSVLAEHAPGVAPRPLRRESESGGPVVVMDRLPGEPLGAAPLDAHQTRALGRALRRVYDVPLAAVRDAGIGERRYGPSTHHDIVAGWLSDSNDVSECREPQLVAEAVDAALDWLARPDQRPEPQLTALGIADLNPANVIWDGTACRLVDFEDGGLTDPAYELADHIEHIAGRIPPVYDAAGLVEAVGLSAEDRARMEAFRPVWAAFWLAMLLPGNGGFRRNPPGTTEAQARHLLAMVD
ncbi:aminoglycoside phosphotransferase family protein [Nocardioides bizhenqiangii]|uniref:Aminoglycoside phosphotransferase family protein n=1 Tax=Nocardioides bizhenqiangii TaxID=3095076 RepID=A0ABZ0ZRY4_9ACTN|nr:aminoglycoside phosphotransferase family protein [Nocardioides sp. HM61]WQQ26536.1 aminoglycoside phosphotransferase family protein [Nocardioides sp. HM61]